MAVISETSDEGSNGGAANKKPQEEEENIPPIPKELPEELIVIIVALVRRYHYPKLSLISKAYRDLISSPELFQTRSRLGFTEPVLYTSIGFPPFDLPSWYILHRISLQFKQITSLPSMLPGSAVVTIDYKMYVLGGFIGLNQPVSTMIVIDCRFHTYRELPSMQRDRGGAAAGVIDGKIYVIGGCKKRYNDWVEVFDVENESWETVPGPYPNVASESVEFSQYAVMEQKIYILDPLFCLTYEPRKRRFEAWGRRSQQRRYESCCVVNDMLCTVDSTCSHGYPIVVYDPKGMVWRPVKGVQSSDLPNLVYYESRMANFGGKLVILGGNQSRDRKDSYLEKDIWCIEIALEKREDGGIWGHVESRSVVLSSSKWPLIALSRSVTV